MEQTVCEGHTFGVAQSLRIRSQRNHWFDALHLKPVWVAWSPKLGLIARRNLCFFRSKHTQVGSRVIAQCVEKDRHYYFWETAAAVVDKIAIHHLVFEAVQTSYSRFIGQL